MPFSLSAKPFSNPSNTLKTTGVLSFNIKKKNLRNPTTFITAILSDIKMNIRWEKDLVNVLDKNFKVERTLDDIHFTYDRKIRSEKDMV